MALMFGVQVHFCSTILTTITNITMSTGDSSAIQDSATRTLLGSYIDVVEARFAENPEVFAQFHDCIESFQSQEDGSISLRDLKSAIYELFDGHHDLLHGFRQLLPGFAAEVESRQKEAKKLQRQKDLVTACLVQTESPLLRLPREIRDNIWSEVVSGNIAHVNKDPATGKFSYHQCVAPTGLKSSVCPPGTGDHAQCSTSGPSNFAGFRRICKQIYLELPDSRHTLFSQNALQFSDLEDAEEFLFSFEESVRAEISHLRLSVPRQVWAATHSDTGHPLFRAWEHINNYCSCPWDRKSLGQNVEEEPDLQYLKAPWYFYYSSCYYTHNRERMYKRWQVGFGGTSWDTSTSPKYKGEPRMDIGINYEKSAESIFTKGSVISFPTHFEYPAPWLISLLQFRHYKGLNMHFWDKDGPKRVLQYEDFIEALKEEMAGAPIGPWKVVEFRGNSNGNPDNHQLPAWTW
ncbi:hypothetical protein ACMFMG_003594 [Clarireedia jacksonii]